MGFLPVFFPPEPGLAQHPVGRLPLPVHGAEFVARFHEYRPELLEDTVLAPPLEPAVDRAIVAEVLGQLVPLAAGAEAEDDAVEGFPPIDPRTTAVAARGPWSVFQEDRLDPMPKCVADLPDGLKGLILSAGPSHPCVSWCAR